MDCVKSDFITYSFFVYLFIGIIVTLFGGQLYKRPKIPFISPYFPKKRIFQILYVGSFLAFFFLVIFYCTITNFFRENLNVSF